MRLPRGLVLLLVGFALSVPLRASSESFAPVEEAFRRKDFPSVVTLAAPLGDAGDGDALFAAGFLFDVGLGVRIDHTRALELIGRAALGGHSLARHYLWWRQQARFGANPQGPPPPASPWGKPATSAEIPPLFEHWLYTLNGQLLPRMSHVMFWLIDRAAEGDVVAQANLAQVYARTEWTKPDFAQHVAWLEKAADGGDAPSAEWFAGYIEAGQVQGGPARAFAYRRVAAEAGLPVAQLNLATAYADGRGVERNLTQAVEWYRKAADQNLPLALLKLSRLLRVGGDGLEKDPVEAQRLVMRAVKLHNVEALMDLAAMLRAGEGAEKNTAEAARLYEQAFELGEDIAAWELAWMHRNAELGPADYAQAYAWFSRAAEKGLAGAMGQIGLLYQEGKGVPQDFEKAFEWIEKAARLGLPWAQNNLGWMLRQGLGCERDDEEAVDWFRLAVKNGEAWGHANLAFHYSRGLGVPKDWIRAGRHAIAAARVLQDPWVESEWHYAFGGGAQSEQRDDLSAMLRELLADPELVKASGGLPEYLLGTLTNTDQLRDDDAARGLSKMLQEAGRTRGFAPLALRTFAGKGEPFDPERARRWAKACELEDPDLGAVLVAQIDSVCASKSEDREAARLELVRRADAGDKRAAAIVASRIWSGIGFERNREQTEHYLKIAQGGKIDQRTLASLDETTRRRKPEWSDSAVAAKISALHLKEPPDAVPQPIVRMDPVYPRELKELGISGEVVVEFVVNTNGHPSEAKIVRSSHPLFSAAAMETVAQWRFLPGRKAGKLVRTRVQQPMTFHMGD